MPKLTIDLSDSEAHALAMLAGSLSEDHYERAVNWWRVANSEVIFTDQSGTVGMHQAYVRRRDVDKAALIEAMIEARSKLYSALAKTGFDIWPDGSI